MRKDKSVTLTEKYEFEYEPRYLEKIARGYDVKEAEEFTRRFDQALRRKDYRAANEFLGKAFEALEKAKIVPATLPSWPITQESNSWIRDIPTVHDFMPLGVTYVEDEDHMLNYPDDPEWSHSCFIPFLISKTADDQHTLISHGAIPFTGQLTDSIAVMLDDREYNFPFRPPENRMYYDGEQRIYPFPTVYNSGEKYSVSLSYNEPEREWIYTAKASKEEIALEVHGRTRSVPFWLGKPEGPYTVLGVYRTRRSVDFWGGFWDVGRGEAKLTMPDVGTYAFRGLFAVDRAVHRARYGGAPLIGAPWWEMSCFGLSEDDLDIMVSRSKNPVPDRIKLKFQHQGRINFPTKGEDFTFNNFEFTDNGGLQPSEYRLTGKYEGGRVDLRGEPFRFYPKKWLRWHGAWWNKKAECTWGRSFIKWKGTITLHGETIEVDALGFGEFTRTQ